MGHSPYNGSLGADPLVRGQVAFAPELKAFSARMSNGSGNFGPSGNSAYSESRFLNSYCLTVSGGNDVIAAAPAFASE